jgi:hypothetical protein
MGTRSAIIPPITKSQFKLGLDCLLKLRHARPARGREAPYPQAASQNDMLRLLAEGGGAVEALWRQKEPGWVGPVGQRDAAIASAEAIRSAVELSRQRGERIPLYEVTVAHLGFLARIDLLRVSTERIEVVEMKAKSVTTSDVADEVNEILGKVGKGRTVAERTILADWVPYLQDLAFQKSLFERWVSVHGPEVGLDPHIIVEPGLILVNKSGSARSYDALRNFTTTYKRGRNGLRAHMTYSGPGCANTDIAVEMKGVSDVVARIVADAQARDPVLAGLGIQACMDVMAEVVLCDRWPEEGSRLSSACKRCEFRTQGPSVGGFDECWGTPRTRLHVLTLPHVKNSQINESIAQSNSRDARASDAPEVEDVRQRAAWTCLQSQPPEPIVLPEFTEDARRSERLRKGPAGEPCYFLDFECSIFPIPSQVGGHPYDVVPFQFEAHQLPCFDAALSDRARLPGFLDLEGTDPRLGFLLALREQLGTSGVVYHWHHYEETVLKELRAWLGSGAPSVPPESEAFIDFINSLVGTGNGGAPGRLCDLMKVAKQVFYHPDMLGSYSIKKVMPLAWKVPAIRAQFWPGHRAANDPESYAHPSDPYLSLPSLPASFLETVGGLEALREIEAAIDQDSASIPDALKNGGMAMLFYHYVRMFGGADRPEIRAQFRNYCGLDSAAMLMVFRYMTDMVPRFRQCADGFSKAGTP